MSFNRPNRPTEATAPSGSAPHLRAVEARLSGLAERAADARDRAVGTPVAASLDRIGSGMARLADDVSAAQHALEDGWSTDDAEALTQLYEAEAPAPLSAAPPLPADQAWVPVKVAHTAAIAGSDRAWLDARLADISARVEAALEAASPEAGFSALGARLDHFEARFSEAISALDRRPDMAAFQALEAQMSDIRTDVQATRRQVMRIDGIERRMEQLTELAHAANDATPEPAAHPSGEAASAVDVDTLMARLSSQLADMRTATLAAAEIDPRFAAQADSLKELRCLLDASVADQKKSAGETAALLETMQEALIRLIDRVEEATELAETEPETIAAEAAAAEPTPAIVGPVAALAPTVTLAPTAPTVSLAPTAPVETPSPVIAAPRTVAGTGTAPETATGQPDRQATAVVARSRRPAVLRDPQAGPIASAIAATATDRIAAQLRGVAGAAPITAPKVDAFSDDKAALDAERARITARKVPSAKATPRPKVEANVQTSADTPARTPGQQGVRLAIIAALLVPISGAAFVLGDRYIGRGATPRAAIETPQSTPTAIVESPIPDSPTTATQPVPATGNAAPARPTDPANAPRRRPTPETVTDDFSQAQPTSPAALPAARPTELGITGIVLDSGERLPNPAELARRVAPTSSATQGPIPVDVHAARTPAPTAIVASPDAAVASSDSDPAPAVRTGVDLPPPQIGPMSLRLAAQHGDPGAQFEVAVRFAEAKGVRQDFDQALIWYQRAAQKGFVPAQYRLATLYERGVVGSADLPRAKVWYKRAAEQGNTKAMHNLAVIATSENPQQPDYLTAARLFTDAAERGLADSQYNLAVLYDTGLGVGRDPMQAYKWYALAARSGDSEAARRRDQVFAGLTPGQTRDAEKSVETFRPRFADPKANDPRAASLAWQQEQMQLRERGERLSAEGRAKMDSAAASAAASPAAPQPAAARPAPKITTRALPQPKPIP